MSRSERLILPRQLYIDMLAHAQAERPNECCGLLAGVIDAGVMHVVKRHVLVNEAASPIEYRSEPRSMFAAVKAMRIDGHEMLAIYHSHPTSTPIPSPTDLERSLSPDLVNFIISLEGPAPVLRGWWLTETAFEEAAWEIVEA